MKQCFVLSALTNKRIGLRLISVLPPSFIPLAHCSASRFPSVDTSHTNNKPESLPHQNIYRTVDTHPEKWPPPHQSKRPYKYRKRYSFKTRMQRLEHPPPNTIKRYVWKAWDREFDPPNRNPTGSGGQTPVTRAKKNVEEMDKKALVNSMNWEHPIRTLSAGTLKSNLKRVMMPYWGSKVRTCLQDVVRLASKTKRICQHSIGLYIEHLSTTGIHEPDREFLDLLSPRVSEHLSSDEEKTFQNGEEDQSLQTRFISSLLVCLYNGHPPPEAKGIATQVRRFITRAKDFLPPIDQPGAIKKKMKYPGSTILQSTASQLAVELRRHYRNGSTELRDRVRILVQSKRVFIRKGLLTPVSCL